MKPLPCHIEENFISSFQSDPIVQISQKLGGQWSVVKCLIGKAFFGCHFQAIVGDFNVHIKLYIFSSLSLEDIRVELNWNYCIRMDCCFWFAATRERYEIRIKISLFLVEAQHRRKGKSIKNIEDRLGSKIKENNHRREAHSSEIESRSKNLYVSTS